MSCVIMVTEKIAFVTNLAVDVKPWASLAVAKEMSKRSAALLDVDDGFC